jgi:DNA invertase Pin-like site-specific DNA recombinase
MVLVDELRRCGVEILFVNRPLGETPEDQLLLQVQGAMAQYERTKIMERCRRGRLHAARQGKLSVLGQGCYGYRYIRNTNAAGGIIAVDRTAGSGDSERRTVRRGGRPVAGERDAKPGAKIQGAIPLAGTGGLPLLRIRDDGTAHSWRG